MPTPLTHTYILCPGQGSQTVGMGKDLSTSPAAAEIFKTANAILGFDLADLCLNGPAEKLNQTDMSQPALYTVGVASYKAAIEQGKLNPADVTAYAGLSLGEYTALHLAGVFSFEDGLRLVAARGRHMQDAATAIPSSMVAIVGADSAAVDQLVADARGGGVLVPANYNAPGQIVISGSLDACERAVALATEKGIKAVPLTVAGAFHSPLMQPGADRMGDELAKVTFHVPTKEVWSNVTGTPHGTNTHTIKDLLVQQITHPVKWEQTMQALVATAPEGRYIELAPGRTLAGLAKKINRRLPIESLGA